VRSHVPAQAGGLPVELGREGPRARRPGERGSHSSRSSWPTVSISALAPSVASRSVRDPPVSNGAMGVGT
jgi:hypothetical protein